MAESSILIFEPGDVIFPEGDRARDLYILEDGVIEIREKDEVKTTLSEKGSFFGEMSFLMGRPRAATFVARTHVKARCIRGGSDFIESVQKYPEVFYRLLKVMATRLDFINHEKGYGQAYRQFRERVYQEAENQGREDLINLYADLDGEINAVQRSKSSVYITEALDIRFMGDSLVKTVPRIMSHYYDREVRVVDSYSGSLLPRDFEMGATISFAGSKNGILGYVMGRDLAQEVAYGFLQEADCSQEVLESSLLELTNQSLGELLEDLHLYDLGVGIPELVSNIEELQIKLAEGDTVICQVRASHGDFYVFVSLTEE
ncbi:MAG: cyclic nucleotide-binding domain-containing protein [Planctomycetes bacterium]|nr:cyclic nucleotide-binding domain-containing protein [Planctomycetota bacterium]